MKISFLENLLNRQFVLCHLFLSERLCLDKQTKEEIVDAGSSSHCFSELQSETVYRISVHSRLGTVEGGAVTILHPTGQNPV